MRRVLPLLMLAVVGTGVALASPSASTVTINAKVNSSLGSKILVNSAGLTLYHYTAEKKGAIACTGGCTSAWPPLLAAGSAKPSAGPGLSASKLGTVKRPDGKMQVTYNGLALYRYAEDKKAGQANGQGEGGAWYAVTPSGAVTKKAAAEVAAKASGTSSSSSSSSSNSTGGAGGAAPAANANCTPGAIVMDAGPCYNY
jgi:predicted lipoprotein with Yx(FWY)xxD motif